MVVNGTVPARDRAYAWVRHEILRGRLAAGEFLEEATVCEAVGVSRTPVREAFHRLAAEKFLTLSPRRGAMVTRVTARDLVEVYQMRLLLETYAVQALTSGGARLGPATFELLDEMDDPDRIARSMAGDEDEWFESIDLDRRFHRSIVTASGNGVLTEMYDYLRSRQQRVAFSAVRADPGRLPLINQQHRELADAITAGDGARAVEVLTEHLRPVESVTSRLDPS